ncbi:MAG: hypothetical protein ABIS47_01370, partial [Acidimicrobiales bacterium]
MITWAGDGFGGDDRHVIELGSDALSGPGTPGGLERPQCSGADGLGDGRRATPNVDGVYERFTRDARRVLVSAQE